MLKSAFVLLTIYSLLLVTIAANAQTQSGPSDNTFAEASEKNANTRDEPKPARKKADLKKVIDDETKRFNADNSRFDPVKLELEKAKQARKSGWSKQDTAIMVVFAVGIAVLVWFVIKYGKECIETTPRGCSLTSDENCYCERYAEDNANRSLAR